MYVVVVFMNFSSLFGSMLCFVFDSVWSKQTDRNTFLPYASVVSKCYCSQYLLFYCIWSTRRKDSQQVLFFYTPFASLTISTHWFFFIIFGFSFLSFKFRNYRIILVMATYMQLCELCHFLTLLWCIYLFSLFVFSACYFLEMFMFQWNFDALHTFDTVALWKRSSCISFFGRF